MSEVTELTPLTWGLIIAWILSSAVMMGVGWLWIVSNVKKHGWSSTLMKTILLRGIFLTLLHLTWLTIIWATTSVALENLLCLWVGALAVLGFAYFNLYIGYRRLKRAERRKAEPLNSQKVS